MRTGQYRETHSVYILLECSLRDLLSRPANTGLRGLFDRAELSAGDLEDSVAAVEGMFRPTGVGDGLGPFAAVVRDRTMRCGGGSWPCTGLPQFVLATDDLFCAIVDAEDHLDTGRRRGLITLQHGRHHRHIIAAGPEITAGVELPRDIEVQQGLHRRVRVTVPPGGGEHVTFALRGPDKKTHCIYEFWKK